MPPAQINPPARKDPAEAIDIPVPEGVHLNSEPRLEKRTWIVQRTAWALSALLLLAVALGLLGRGYLSRMVGATADGSLRVEYHRFLRAQGFTETEVSVLHTGASGTGRAGEVRVWISTAFLETMSIERITPPPSRTEIRPGRFVLIFDWAAGDRSLMTVVMRFDIKRAGVARYDLGLGPEREPERTVAVRQWIYP